MKPITINPNSKKYFSDAFLEGIKYGAQRQYEADEEERIYWIPCSERLPSEGEYVLVTEKWHGYVWMWRLQYIDNEPTWEVDGYNVDIDEAVAWMPRPEPYRKED